MRKYEHLDGTLVVVLAPLLSAVRFLALPGGHIVDLSHKHDVHVGGRGDVREDKDDSADEEHVGLETSEADVTIVEELQRVYVFDSLTCLIVKIVGLHSE